MGETETQIATLSVRVAHLESASEVHHERDEKQFKYLGNMIEDALGKLGGFERDFARLEAERNDYLERRKDMSRQIDKLSDNIDTIRRMIWLAMGAVGGVGAIATFFGWNILKLLGK